MNSFQLMNYRSTSVTVQAPAGNLTGGGSNSDLSNRVVTFNPDGTLSYSGVSGPLSPADWAIPTTAGAGDSYWISISSTLSGTTTSRASINTGGRVSLATAQSGGLRATSTGTSGTTIASCTYSISTDAAGTDIVASGSFQLTVSYT